MSVNSASSGTISEIPGNIEVAMMIAATVLAPRNCSLARAYAANVPISSVRIVVVPATITLLSSERPNPTSGPNTASRFSVDTGAGNRLLENWSDGRRNADTTIQ